MNMNDLVVAEMFQRIISLESRVAALEPVLATRQDEAGPDHVPASSPADLRPKAIQGVRVSLKQLNPEANLQGSHNRGSNPLVITGEEGLRHRIYLTSSRDYNEDQDDFFSSWHTIKTTDVDSNVYEAFVLVPFSKSGEPEFFIYTASEMRAATRLKKASGGFYHFYISPGDPGAFVDRRVRKVADGSTDITQFHNAWHSLPGV